MAYKDYYTYWKGLLWMIIYLFCLDISSPFSSVYDRLNSESQTKNVYVNILKNFLTEPNFSKKKKCSFWKSVRFEVQNQIVALIKSNSKSMHKFSHVILFEHYAQVALLL